jgi:hypothetical protein
MLFSASAKTTLNTSDPVGFFTTVANRMLLNTFNFGVTNIPVYSNGVFVYTPSVQRSRGTGKDSRGTGKGCRPTFKENREVGTLQPRASG